MVYLAEDTSLGREVALKILHPQLARDTEFLARFKREARLVASLPHPNVVRIHAFEEVEGRFIIDTEYLAGGPLSAHCARSVFESETIAKIALDVLSALEFCHGREILHRDIKPSNILLDEVGNAQVADFGVAKAMEAHLGDAIVSETSTGVFLGTPRYAPPEAWEGRAQTAQSDLYALGVVLHEMVTGRSPYEAQTPLALMREMLTSPVCRLDPIETGLSTAFADLINDLVQHAPEARPASATEARERLAQSPEGQALADRDVMLATQRLLLDESTKIGGLPDETTAKSKAPAFSRRQFIGGGVAVLGMAGAVYYRSAPGNGPRMPGATPDATRLLLADAIQDRIPPLEALRECWRDDLVKSYAGERLSSGPAVVARWLFFGGLAAEEATALFITQKGMHWLTLSRQSGTVQGAWAALEDDANTILRYGTLTGRVAGQQGGRALTITVERICEQDQTIEGESWHLDESADQTDTAVLLDFEASAKLQTLLFDELLPRQLNWAVELAARLPAIAEQRVTAMVSEAPIPETPLSPAQLRAEMDRRRSDGQFALGIPTERQASCAAIQDTAQLLILLHVPGLSHNDIEIQIALSPAPVVVSEGASRNVLSLVSNPSSGIQGALTPTAPVEWSMDTAAEAGDLFAQIRIPLASVPGWMRRPFWRLNMAVGRSTEGAAPLPLVVFGAPELSSIEHGLLLQLDPTVCGWL